MVSVSPATRTSCCVAQVLTDHGPEPVGGPKSRHQHVQCLVRGGLLTEFSYSGRDERALWGPFDQGTILIIRVPP